MRQNILFKGLFFDGHFVHVHSQVRSESDGAFATNRQLVSNTVTKVMHTETEYYVHAYQGDLTSVKLSDAYGLLIEVDADKKKKKN